MGRDVPPDQGAQSSVQPSLGCSRDGAATTWRLQVARAGSQCSCGTSQCPPVLNLPQLNKRFLLSRMFQSPPLCGKEQTHNTREGIPHPKFPVAGTQDCQACAGGAEREAAGDCDLSRLKANSSLTKARGSREMMLIALPRDLIALSLKVAEFFIVVCPSL